MAVAIATKYLGPTEHRGSRIVATVPARVADSRRHEHDEYCAAIGAEHAELYRVSHWRLTIPYPHEVSSYSGHRLAAGMLADRLGWTGTLAGGATDDGYVFVFTA